MGREIKRVPLDFEWPLNEGWRGFLMPDRLHDDPCPAGRTCFNGATGARAWVQQMAHMLLMLDDDRSAQERGRPMHPYFASMPWPYRTGDWDQPADSRRPSADIAEFGTGLAGRESSWLGHDAIDRWQAEEKLIRAAGLDPETWGLCPTCKGHGSVEKYPGQRADAEAWEGEEPPTGHGWQLWETVSEGSPISPVFASAEALAEWMSTPACRRDNPRWFGTDEKVYEYDVALRFAQAGWAPSLASGPAGVMDGVTWVGSS